MPVTALVLPGQGSQRPGMGAPWVGTPQWRLVDEASEVLDLDVAALLLDADAETLRRTDVAQLATHVVSLLALAAVRSHVPAPVLVAGHSLGEYTALVAAGVLQPAASVPLVAARGAAMRAAAEARPGTMAAVLGVEAAVVEAACEGVEAWPATYNAPLHTVVSGTAEGVAAAGEAARAAGARRVLPLPVGGAFHTPLMAPALPALEAALAGVVWAPAVVPVVGNVDALAHTDGWAARLAAQLLSPVRWSQTLQLLLASGVERVVECGPGGVLTALAARVDGLSAVAVSEPAHLERLA